ncbi:PREDICTED: F-box protein At5g07610-like [Fragaria vesca subsp. vesca]
MLSLCLKSSKVCSSAEMVGDNEDLLREILLRVPAQPLVRFKCVSKYWLSFISNPIFCDAHTRRNANPKVSGFFYNETTSNPGLKFISLCNKENNPSGSKALRFVVPDSTNVKILHSCNGLLLCSINGQKIATGTYPIRKYCVINPTTSQIKQLPRAYAPKRSKWTHLIGAALAIDPSKSPH